MHHDNRENIVITHNNYFIAGEIVGSVYFYKYVPYVMINKKKLCAWREYLTIDLVSKNILLTDQRFGYCKGKETQQYLRVGIILNESFFFKNTITFFNMTAKKI